MLSRSQKRFVFGAATLVVMVLFVVPFINVNRYRLSVGAALSQGLGRQVTIDGVSIQTFPQLGLLLQGVVVADDPNVSAEPMLRADEVLATIRLSSLWRGHLEVGSLKLKYPSVNLVRTTDARWNLESLLERARQVPSAPTTKTSPEARPRFPYIEANSGRINLKVGTEKKVFALNDADFSLWLASEDEWRMRLKAHPVRTDANLTDTGTIKLEGAWRRAATLHETPLHVRVSWDDGQLGQLTSLLYGRDRGWRGGVKISAIFDGRPDDLKITTDTRVDDFRRYDIAVNEPLSLQAHCDARYNFTDREVSGLFCQSPMGSGGLQAYGGFGVMPKRNVDLTFSAENVPAQFVASLLRRAKKNVPEDLNASGTVAAGLMVRTDENGVNAWAGTGQTSEIQLRSSVLTQPLSIDATRWHLIGPGIQQPTPATPNSRNPQLSKDELPKPTQRVFAFEPVSLDLAGASPATLSGWFSRDEFFAELRGEASIERLIQAGKLFGVPTVSADFTGIGEGKIHIAGSWQGFALPTIFGNAQLRNVTAKINGVASPLRIQSALFNADHETVSLTKAEGSFADVQSSLGFYLTWPRNCLAQDDSAACAMEFDLKADQLNLDEINSLLNPKAQKRPWYAAIANTVMGSSRKSLPEINATGHFSAGKLIVKNVTAAHVSGNVKITPSSVTLETVNADLLGGKYVGDITADFSGSTPVYSSQGNLLTLGVANVAALTHDSWGSGKVTAFYKGTTRGWNADDILSSVKGTANFQWRDGVLHHINLDSNGRPLQFKLFAGKLDLNKGVLTVSESKLEATKSIYLVSGTASLGRDLEFQLSRDGAPMFSVSGTLNQPKVSPAKVPQTQAALQ